MLAYKANCWFHGGSLLNTLWKQMVALVSELTKFGAQGDYDTLWSTVWLSKDGIWISQFEFFILFCRIQVLKALALSYYNVKTHSKCNKQNSLSCVENLYISICMQCFCFRVFSVAVTDMLMICYCYLECIQLHTTDFIFVQRSKNLRL